MIAADSPVVSQARLLTVRAGGQISHLQRDSLARLFEPGDLVVANDSATLPASLRGTHCASGKPVEVRLAGWIRPGDPTQFKAVLFGAGDYRTPTERRPPPPQIDPGDKLSLGPLDATIVRVLCHRRLVELHFAGDRGSVFAGLAKHGQPIQYAHVPEPLKLWDVWTSLSAYPDSFEPPSAGFAVTWETLSAWRKRGIEFATLTHAAGISSTGDLALDRRLPFDEPYSIPARTAGLINRTKGRGGRVIAIGTTVVRALEAAALIGGSLRAGSGIACNKIEPGTPVRIVDTLLTGIHQPGESHYDLLRAFMDGSVLDTALKQAARKGYLSHEFGDSMLVERQASYADALSIRCAWMPAMSGQQG